MFQVAMAIVVLTGAGLLLRSLQQLERLNPGFDVDAVVVLDMAWAHDGAGATQSMAAVYDLLVPRLEALPDVVAAAPVNVAPFTGAAGGWDGSIVTDRDQNAAHPPVVSLSVVGPHYFRALGIPVARGPSFTEADREGRPRVAIVSDRVARLLWRGEDAVGRRLALGRPAASSDWWTVVGTVAETRYRALREPAPTVYLPYTQFGEAVSLIRTIAVRTRRDPALVLPLIRHAIQQIDPGLIIMSAQPMRQLIAGQLVRPRLDALLLAAFGAGALLLTAAGLYAVLACSVRQRTRELAIRHALGATPGRLRSFVLRQAGTMTGLGVTIGVITALASARLLRSLLFGVSTTDARTLTAAILTLIAAAFAASLVPANRAMRADPANSLRDE
jgi:putative ABC transport system permease protein